MGIAARIVFAASVAAFVNCVVQDHLSTQAPSQRQIEDEFKVRTKELSRAMWRNIHIVSAHGEIMRKLDEYEARRIAARANGGTRQPKAAGYSGKLFKSILRKRKRPIIPNIVVTVATTVTTAATAISEMFTTTEDTTMSQPITAAPSTAPVQTSTPLPTTYGNPFEASSTRGREAIRNDLAILGHHHNKDWWRKAAEFIVQKWKWVAGAILVYMAGMLILLGGITGRRIRRRKYEVWRNRLAAGLPLRPS
jgi:hypothetical protein